MLSLERLRVLHAVSTAGSVVDAARILHVTTSAVSQQIARLGREVGQELAERHGRGIRLTEAGTLLARESGALLAHAERVEATLAEHRGLVAGTLSIAAFATAARALLPVLRDLRSRHPAVSVSSSEMEPHESIPALQRAQLDLAIVQDWTDDVLTVPEDLSRQHLINDRFDLALPVDHPLADRDSVAVTELTDDDWIGWSTGEICHDWLIRTLSANGTQPRIRHTASEHSTQLALTAAGLGVAVLPRLGREPAPPSVRFVSIDPPPTRRIFALWRTSTTSRPSIGAALAAFQQAG